MQSVYLSVEGMCRYKKATYHHLVKWVLEGLGPMLHSPSTSLQTRDTAEWPFLMSTAFPPLDSTSTLAGPSPRAVQLPECRVQPLPALAQLPMSTLLDPK